MDTFVDPDRLLAAFIVFRDFLATRVTTHANLLQMPAIFVTLFAAWLAARVADPWLRRIAHDVAVDEYQEAFYVQNVVPLSFPAAWVLALWLSAFVAGEMNWPRHIVDIAVDLAAAWLLIRTASALIPNVAISRVVAIAAWGIAALHVVGLLSPVIALLQKVSFALGASRVSLLTIAEALLTLVVLLWLSSLAGNFVERRLAAVANLTATGKVLLGKVVKLVLISLAFVFALATAGIDLTALAVFTGAVGVGIGFGLQRTVSNLFAGIVLLLDKSIKPGDILEVGGTFGWVAALGARYVEVETRDGTQFLIPNEDIITQQVFNWTHQNDNVRLKIRVRVAYDADVRQALGLMRLAADKPPRVLKTPAPNPLVIGFGENGLDLELRFWIADVRNGVHNVESEVFLEILDLFRAHAIHIPLPQRDVRVQSLPPAFDRGEAGDQGGGGAAIDRATRVSRETTASTRPSNTPMVG